MNKAVFIDKDGTLIEDVPFNSDPQQVRLSSHCLEGLKKIASAGFKLVVVSNQAGIALAKLNEAALRSSEQRIKELLGQNGIMLSGFYYCPHHPFARLPQFRVHCECRKPKPGMLLKAGYDLNLTLSGSWMVGDILDDIEAGRSAGCRTILVANGNEDRWLLSATRVPDCFVKSINEAAEYIIGERKQRGHAGEVRSTSLCRHVPWSETSGGRRHYTRPLS